jgi:hypothetical protein
MHLAGLDDKDIAGTGLETHAIHHVATTPRLDELDFVVRVSVGTRTGARCAVEQEHRGRHVALVGADELMRAAPKRQLVTMDSMQ